MTPDLPIRTGLRSIRKTRCSSSPTTDRAGSRRADQEIRTGVPGLAKDGEKDNWPLGREYAIPGSGTNAEPSITVHALVRHGQRPPGARHQGTEDATELADRPRLRCRAPRAVRRQRHGPVDPGVRRQRPGRRRPEARAQGIADQAGESDRRHTRSEEQRAVGVELRRPLRHRVSASTPVAILRRCATIRSAPESAPSLMIGNPGALTYDSKREEILVPN